MTPKATGRALLFIALLVALVLAWMLWPARKPADIGRSSSPSTKAVTSESSNNERRESEDSPAEKRTTVEKPEQWRTIAKGAYLQLVYPQSLTLHRGVVALLDLTPSESKELNTDLESFIERLRAAERKHAYVLVGSGGSEQIVVEPFDRGPLIRRFRDTVAGHLGENVADFCAEQVLYDPSLALGNREVRLHIEAGENGKDVMVISRGVHRRNPTGDPKWQGDAAPPVVTRMPAQKDFGIRYRHLSAVANNLPRRAEPGK